jgi:hypothetical protein
MGDIPRYRTSDFVSSTNPDNLETMLLPPLCRFAAVTYDPGEAVDGLVHTRSSAGRACISTAATARYIPISFMESQLSVWKFLTKSTRSGAVYRGVVLQGGAIKVDPVNYQSCYSQEVFELTVGIAFDYCF